MAIAFVQSLGSNQSKTAGTSLAIAVASLTVTAGNDIFVAFEADDVGSGFSCTDSLGNTYSLRATGTLAANCKCLYFRSTITTGGTLTSITVSWTTNITAKALQAGEWSGVGTERGTDTGTNPSISNNLTIVAGNVVNFFTGDLLVGGCAWERPNSDDLSVVGVLTAGTGVEVAQDGTTGGGAASNICGHLGYSIATGNGTTSSQELRSTNNTTVADAASAGGVYAPAAVAAADPYPYTRYGYYPTEG